jgi:hypothetical protein
MLGMSVIGTIIAIAIVVWLARRGVSKHRARMGVYDTSQEECSETAQGSATSFVLPDALTMRKQAKVG